MSTEYTTKPRLVYDEFVKSLPKGVTVKWNLEGVPEGTRSDPNYSGPHRLYIASIIHVLLQDECGNTLWMRKLADGTTQFEKFGLQGSLGHIGSAFKEAKIHLLDLSSWYTYQIEGRACRCGKLSICHFDPEEAEQIEP